MSFTTSPLYLFSNTSDKTNTLSNFTSYLPSNYQLEENTYIAIQEIGFQWQEKRKLLSERPFFVILMRPNLTDEYKYMGQDAVRKIIENYGMIGSVYEENNWLISTILEKDTKTPEKFKQAFDKCVMKIKNFRQNMTGNEKTDPLPFKLVVEDKKLIITHTVESENTINKYGKTLIGVIKDSYHQFSMDWFIPTAGFQNLQLELLSRTTNKSVSETFIVLDTFDTNHHKFKWSFQTVAQMCKKDLIHIYCDAIEEKIHGDKRERILRSFFIDGKEGEEMYHVKAFKNMEYHPLNSSYLSKINIKIRDDCGKAPTKDGLPTYVKIDCKTMTSKVRNVVLTSDTSNPENSAWKFRVDLPEKIEFDNTWKMALTSFNAPATLYMFYNNGTPIEISICIEEKIYKCEIPIYTKSVKDLMQILNGFLSLYKVGKIRMTTFMNTHAYFLLKKNVKLVLPHPIGWVLGFQEDKVNVTDITLDSMEFEESGPDPNSDSSYVMGKKAYHDVKLMESLLYPPYYLVYCNISENVVAGETLSRLLKVIHHNSKDISNNRINIEFTHLDYIPLSLHSVRHIDIEIREVNGKFVAFEDSGDVVLNIEFKQEVDELKLLR